MYHIENQGSQGLWGHRLVIHFDQIEYAQLTDVGVRRSHNQDSYAVLLANDEEQWRQRGHLYIVADGMGAHAVGEKASEQAVGLIPHNYQKYATQGPVVALRKSFIEANASIHACGQANPEFEGMGTTGSALLLRPEGAWIGHVGDSRVYRIRDGVIDQLTYDHSLVWEYARLKHLDPDEVVDIPSNVIHRCLGPEAEVQVDIEGPYPHQGGDIFVLCSDGLSGLVSDAEIGAFATALPPEEATRFLIDLANLRGGPDNITVVVVKLGAGAEANGVPAFRETKRGFSLPGIPWWMTAFGFGLVFLALAAFLQNHQYWFGTQTFVAAFLAIAIGMIGLILHYRQEQKSIEAENSAEDPPQARIHRSHPCRIEDPILERLARAVHTLRQRAEDHNWHPDLKEYELHIQQAEALVEVDDTVGSFREYCRAMLPLSRALSKHRRKEEVFQPVWDKPPRQRSTFPARQTPAVTPPHGVK